jgi:hypothetical protein
MRRRRRAIVNEMEDDALAQEKDWVSPTVKVCTRTKRRGDVRLRGAYKDRPESREQETSFVQSIQVVPLFTAIMDVGVGDLSSIDQF